MNRKIIILTDYKGFFESKQKSLIYRGGMDVSLILSIFNREGYDVSKISFSQLNINDMIKDRQIVLYTSSEDKNGFYKSFIEDIIFHLENLGIIVLPRFAYLKAHNNKVAMELLRDRSDFASIKTIKSSFFGTIEELKQQAYTIKFPVVIKSASGAMSRGVAKANNADELIKRAYQISNSHDFFHDTKELLRKLKYRNKYIRESFHRNKFVVQNLIPGLNNDWKVLVYGNKCYVLYRGNRENDFRASGSGDFEFRKNIPDGILDYALNVRNHFNVPHISLDIGFDGKKFHLIEFQFLYYGTTTIEKSFFYFEKVNGNWEIWNEKSLLEEVYVKSIIDFIVENNI